MNAILDNLHSLEDRLIEIEGLMKALQDACGDDSVRICLSNVLAEKLQGLQQQFYSHWEAVVKAHKSQPGQGGIFP